MVKLNTSNSRPSLDSNYSHPSFVRALKIVHSKGSTTTTLRGVLAFAKKHGLSVPGQKYKAKEKFKSFPIYDTTLGSGARNICEENNPRLKNWNGAEPSIYSESHNRVDHINEGRYSSRCSYIKWSYTPRYHSELKVARSSKAVAFLHQSGKLLRTLYAPSGLSWGWDSEGPFLKAKDGVEYHPSSDDLKRKDFVANIRAKLSESRSKRRANKKSSKDALAGAKFYDKMKGRVTVTLQDSLESGNCLEGSVNYLLSKGFDRRFIISPYSSVPANKLDDSNPRVRAAIERAVERSYLVSI